VRTSRTPAAARPDRIPSAATRTDGTATDGTATDGPATDGTGPEDTATGADALRVVLLVSRARTAARSGDLDGALRLLQEAGDPVVAGHHEVLDLLARVHAQRGELALAAACWRRIQERRPGDRSASAGLARIGRLGRRGPRAALARHRAGTALAAAVCAVAAITAGTVVVTDDAGERPGRPAPSQADRAEQLAQRLDAELRARQEQERARESARRVDAAATLARELRAPGIDTAVHGDAVEVTFADGLFAEADRLTPLGADRLAVLGGRLAGRQARVEILGHAATVPGAPTSGGSVLSLWRALIAARELSAASGEPLTAFTTASADQRDAPYATAARNRTVTVVITPG
jgi:hypothetical protein